MVQRVLCHLDMDAFFASVEEKHDPTLNGKPVLVAAGPVGRGAVASCNYVARKLGVKTGMSTAEALRLFPQAVVVRANYERYQEASEQILRVIYRFTPDVEPLSLDESFFEFTHVPRWRDDPLAAAQAIQRAIDEELRLSSSIGIASGKVLAKIGSDFKKPHGITMVPFSEDGSAEKEWIATLPVEAVPGVGYATQRKLTEHGVRVCGDICGMNLGLLHKQFGQVHGGFLWNLAHGRDARQLMKRGAAKSISHQSTLQRTTTDKDYVESLLMYIAERCLWRLRTAQMRTRSFSIYMRFADQRYGQRVTHLKNGTQSEHVILPLISQMTREIWMLNPKPRVTFVGVHLSDFQPATPQGELFFDDTEKKERLSRAMGSLREKFGSPVITSARTFGLHHSYRLSQAGLSFSVATVEEKEAAEMAKREAEEYMAMDLVM